MDNEEEYPDERKIENSDWSFLERTAGVAVGGTLAALGAMGVMTGLSALQSAVSGVGVYTDERKVFGTNTHKLERLGFFGRVGTLAPASYPFVGGLLLMAGGTALVDYSWCRKFRNINFYTREDLKGDGPLNAGDTGNEVSPQPPSVDDIMEDDESGYENTQFSSNPEKPGLDERDKGRIEGFEAGRESN